jgi:hypothetical protein
MGFILNKVAYGLSAALRPLASLEKALLFRASAQEPRKPKARRKSKAAKLEAVLESAIAPPVAPIVAAVTPAPTAKIVVMPAPTTPVKDLAVAAATTPTATASAAPTFVMTAPEVPPPVIKPRNDPQPGALFPVATYKLVPSAESPVYTFASHAHAAATPAGSHGFDSASGDEYEDFIAHMKTGKRPFRKPGISIKQEFELWHAARAKAHAHAASHPNGLGRLLQVGRNFN